MGRGWGATLCLFLVTHPHTDVSGFKKMEHELASSLLMKSLQVVTYIFISVIISCNGTRVLVPVAFEKC